MIRKFLLALTLCVALLAPLSAAQAQGGDDPNALLDTALAFLAEQLGVTLSRQDLSGWTWQEVLWPDTSLGCPQPDQVYSQVLTRGYDFRLTTGSNIYEIHLTPDGTTAVFCGVTAAAPAPTATALPSLPQAATPTAGATPAAAISGEELVNIGIAYLNSQLGATITRRDLSRWTWEATTWPDRSLGCPQPDVTYDSSAPVPGYILTIEYVDRIYELHLTADRRTIMPCGDDERLQPAIDIDFASTLTALATPTPAAPEAIAGDRPILFYTGADGNVYRASWNAYPGTNVTEDIAPTPATPSPLPRFDHIYGYYRWSPDGQRVAFLDSAPPARLLVADAEGGQPVQLATDLALLYPPAWSPDGSALAYVRPTQTFRANSQVMEVYAVAVPGSDENTAPRLLATFEQGVGCGGGSSDPADTVYSRETGYTGNALMLVWLPGDTLLLTPSCTGAGLARLDLSSGELTLIDPALSRVALSPDRSRAAGITVDANGNRTLTLVTLGSGESQPVPVSGTPDQVLWSADGQHLYISTVEPLERVARSGGEESIGVYAVRLWRIDLSSGEATLLFEQEGRGIGTLTEALDGRGMIFSFVEDSRAWLQAVETNASADAQREAAPGAWLLLLTPDGAITRLGRGGQPALQPYLSEAAQG